MEGTEGKLLNSEDLELLARARDVANNMQKLAVEYQAVVRSTDPSGAEGQKARRSLDRKFQKLKVRDAIGELRQRGYEEVAEKVSGLFSASAMVFNLVAVSVGVDECEVLEIDVAEPLEEAIRSIEATLNGTVW